MKLISLPLLALTSLALFTACDPITPPVPTPTFDLVLTPTNQTVAVNTSSTVTASITPKDGYNQPVTYAAQGDMTLSVSQQGNVFTVVSSVPGPHTMTVTATGQDRTVKTATATITVTGTNPDPDPGTNPTHPFFIPAPNAPIGSGIGTTLGRVYVSPTAAEIEVLNLVNEVRTKGTLNGQAALAGTCVSGTWTPRQAMTYNGLYAFAARKHAEYMSNVGFEGHSETIFSSPYFYGTNPSDRVIRAYREQAGLSKPYVGTNDYRYGGELAGTGRPTPLVIVQDWLASSYHCTAMMDSRVTMFGSGAATGSYEPNMNLWGTSWSLIVGWE